MKLPLLALARLRRREGEMAEIKERLNPLLKPDALQAADEAACRLDAMFRDIFNAEERMDLIVTIIRAATTSALGLPARLTVQS